MINARLVFDHLKSKVVAHFTFGILQKLDDENTVLRAEHARCGKERLAFANDLSNLARGGKVKTPLGIAAQTRLLAAEERVRKLEGEQQILNTRERQELEAMRAVLAPIGEKPMIEVLRSLRGRDLSVTPFAYLNILNRFEGFEIQRNCPELPAPVSLPARVWDTGKDKWTAGERDADGRRYLGPCPVCGSRTVDHGGPWMCTNTINVGCSLARSPMVRQNPHWWVGNIFVKTDGEVWLAARDGFVNIQESACAFACTPHEAVTALLRDELISEKPIPELDSTDVS